jgi:phosphonate transport system substrate-binding protein
MLHRLPIRSAALLFVLLLGACNGAQKERQELLYTAIPDQNSTELIEKFAPLTNYLAETLGVTVRYVPARDYQASVEMFRNGDVHLAWFGGLTGVQARAAVPGAEAVAQGLADPKYYSYFIAHRDAGLTPGDDFPMGIGALSFTFGSASSTSGRLMPEFFIRKNSGQAPADLFGAPNHYSGSHDKTVELVESGRFQAGVVNYKVYDRRVAEGKTDPDLVRVIWRTPIYADYNWTAHPLLDEQFGDGFVRKVQQALVAIEDPSLLSALPRERLIPAHNDEFDGIRDVAIELDMLR